MQWKQTEGEIAMPAEDLDIWPDTIEIGDKEAGQQRGENQSMEKGEREIMNTQTI